MAFDENWHDVVASKTAKQAAAMLRTRVERAYKDLREAESLAEHIEANSAVFVPVSRASAIAGSADAVRQYLTEAYDDVDTALLYVRDVEMHLP